MRAGQTTLKRLIEGEKQYRIPIFQRPYTWEARELQQLWKDMVAQYEVLASNPDSPDPSVHKSSHFFGSFVLSPVPGRAAGVAAFLVVDGQQRLATMLLALAAIRDVLALKDDQEVEKFNRLYLKNEYAEGSEKYKLLPSRVDQEAFLACMDRHAPSGGNAKITAAYRFFALQFGRPLVDSDAPIDLNLMKEVIVERLAVVDITTEADDNPYRIFESLNGTGVGLTQADLLRNYLFMLLPTRGPEVYDQYWFPMEKALGAENLEGLARVDLQRRGVVAARDDIYRLHQERLEPYAHDEAQVANEIAQLARRAQYYRRLIDPSAEADGRIRRSLTGLKRWGAQTTYPLLMHIYDLLEQGITTLDDFALTLEYVESFIVRRFLVQVPTNQLNRLFIDMIKNITGDKPVSEVVRDELSGERRYWPTDEQVREAVRSRPFYFMGRYDQRKLVLERIEESFEHKEKLDLPNITLTIEHILPQTLSEGWRAELIGLGQDPDQVQSELVHTLGNLSLTAYNGELSNNSIDRKAQIYGDSNLELNKALEGVDVWGREQILERSAALAETIIKIWPSPIPGARGAVLGFDWSRIDAAVAAVPPGRWTSYGDLAELGGTHAQPVGVRMGTVSLPTAYRVMDRAGRITPGFHWADPSDTRNPKDVLVGEGIRFDPNGQADPKQRLNSYQLAQLIPYELDSEEIQRLWDSSQDSKPEPPRADRPWLTDGPSWHLSQIKSPSVREILLRLVDLIREAVPEAGEPFWQQQRYISWRDSNSHFWGAFYPRVHYIYLELYDTPFTAKEASERLGFAFVPQVSNWNSNAVAPSQVAMNPGGSGIAVQFRSLGELSGNCADQVRRLARETFDAISDIRWREGDDSFDRDDDVQADYPNWIHRRPNSTFRQWHAEEAYRSAMPQAPRVPRLALEWYEREVLGARPKP